jgi:putrescine transport system permease protein
MSARLYVVVAAAFAFLYIPIVALVVYSFNASPRVTVWQGFSTRWYGALLEDRQIIDAAFLSSRIATINATFAMVLGALAAFVLVRYTRFRGRTVFTGLVAAPLVMPEVITGLSLLLLFVASESLFGWPAQRGITTITIAHITFSMAFVASWCRRVCRLRPLAGRSAESRRTAVKVYLHHVAADRTALIGWLLAFTMSLDDLVISSFVSGLGSSTLPMVVFLMVRRGFPEINALRRCSSA